MNYRDFVAIAKYQVSNAKGCLKIISGLQHVDFITIPPAPLAARKTRGRAAAPPKSQKFSSTMT
jgi:hypothetical protein